MRSVLFAFFGVFRGNGIHESPVLCIITPIALFYSATISLSSRMWQEPINALSLCTANRVNLIDSANFILAKADCHLLSLRSAAYRLLIDASIQLWAALYALAYIFVFILFQIRYSMSVIDLNDFLLLLPLFGCLAFCFAVFCVCVCVFFVVVVQTKAVCRSTIWFMPKCVVRMCKHYSHWRSPNQSCTMHIICRAIRETKLGHDRRWWTKNDAAENLVGNFAVAVAWIYNYLIMWWALTHTFASFRVLYSD